MHPIDSLNSHSDAGEGVALVIGGSGGIGAAVCQSLAQRGSHVALTYRSNRSAAEQVASTIVAAGRRAKVDCLDIESPPAVKAVVASIVEQFGSIHSLVYAAGPALEFLLINQITAAEWARVFASDVNGCFNVIEAVLPHLRRQQHGSIVALIMAAVDRSPPRDILSAAPKAAIEMLIRGVAREEGRCGIRANCVGPGYISAGLGLKTVHGHTQDYVQKMIRAIPLQRAGTAQDVADVVCFLLSDQARYVTGVSIPVAGGLQLA